MTLSRSLKLTVLALAVSSIMTPLAVRAQNEALPKLPPAIQTLVDQGAQVRFLGKDFGLEGWIVIKNGQEQFFYVLPSGEAFVSGILVDAKGKVITTEQAARLRQSGDDLLEKLSSDNTAQAQASGDTQNKYEFKTPSEKLYYDMENSNWIPLGQAGAPMMYAFIDPNCQHCHAMMNELKEKYIDTGAAQLRIVPVGFTEQSKAQAAFLMAAPDPAGLLWKHLGGDKEALPAKAEINQQGVERNMAIMQSWKFNVTPMVIYRDKANKVKIVKGRPKDIETLVKDLGVRS